jgi:hypothetical protein
MGGTEENLGMNNQRLVGRVFNDAVTIIELMQYQTG